MSPRRRRRNEPDTRLDWRDPNMPVLLRMDYGEGPVLDAVPPKRASAYAREAMKDKRKPIWQWDETYHMRRR